MRRLRREEEVHVRHATKLQDVMRIGDAVWKNVGVTHVAHDNVRIQNGRDHLDKFRRESLQLLQQRREVLKQAMSTPIIHSTLPTARAYFQHNTYYNVSRSPFNDLRSVVKLASSAIPLDPRSVSEAIAPHVFEMASLRLSAEDYFQRLSATGIASFLHMEQAYEMHNLPFMRRFQGLLYNFSALRHPPVSSIDDPFAFATSGHSFILVLHDLDLIAKNIVQFRAKLLRVKTDTRHHNLQLDELKQLRSIHRLPLHLHREISDRLRWLSNEPQITPLMRRALFHDAELLADENMRARITTACFPYANFDVSIELDKRLDAVYQFVSDTVSRALECLQSTFAKALLYAAIHIPTQKRCDWNDIEKWKAYIAAFLALSEEDQAREHALNLHQKIGITRLLRSTIAIVPSEEDFRAWIYSEKQLAPRTAQLTSDPLNRQRPIADGGNLFMKRLEIMTPHFGVPFTDDKAWLQDRLPYGGEPQPKKLSDPAPSHMEFDMPGDIEKKADQARLDPFNTPFGTIPLQKPAPKRDGRHPWKSSLIDFADWAKKSAF